MREILPEDRINRELAARSGFLNFVHEIERTIAASGINRVARKPPQSQARRTGRTGGNEETKPRAQRSVHKSASSKRIDLAEAVKRTQRAIKRHTAIPPRAPLQRALRMRGS